MKINLIDYGLTDRYIAEKSMYDGKLHIARVIAQYRDIYKVITEDGEVLAEISGKMQYEATSLVDYPSVGDFVLVDRTTDITGNAIISNVLTRRTSFERKVVGDKADIQVVASNIDTVFICMSLNENFNLRRLERYIAVALDSRANPIILLTKSDLCENIEERLEQVKGISVGIDIVIANAVSDNGYTELIQYITKGKTFAFIGSSGVGKSTLINKILKKDILETKEIGEGDKGRHTTTVRQMFLSPDGGILIDTPGMRELGIVGADVENTFSDIEELATNCKFRDCIHETEPGCAVRKAIEDGIIDKKRLTSYKKLKRESEYSELNFRELENKKIENMFGSKNQMKQFINNEKKKNSRRYEKN